MIEVSLNQTKNMQTTQCVRIDAETVVPHRDLMNINHESRLAKSNSVHNNADTMDMCGIVPLATIHYKRRSQRESYLRRAVECLSNCRMELPLMGT